MRLLRPWDFGGTRHASHAPSPTGAAGAANRSTSLRGVEQRRTPPICLPIAEVAMRHEMNPLVDIGTAPTVAVIGRELTGEYRIAAQAHDRGSWTAGRLGNNGAQVSPPALWADMEFRRTSAEPDAGRARASNTDGGNPPIPIWPWGGQTRRVWGNSGPAVKGASEVRIEHFVDDQNTVEVDHYPEQSVIRLYDNLSGNMYHNGSCLALHFKSVEAADKVTAALLEAIAYAPESRQAEV